MLRTAEQYKKGLRDARKVFIRGKPVPDVTQDPYIKVGVETAAHDFLMAHDPEMRDIAVMEDPQNGEPVSTYFELPDYPEAVAKRHQLVKRACYFADGAIPFVKDVGIWAESPAPGGDRGTRIAFTIPKGAICDLTFWEKEKEDRS